MDDATPEQQNIVSKFLKTKPYGFWHHFSDSWFVTDRSETLTPLELRDELKRLLPGKTTFVVQMDDPTNWAGFGKTENFKWLRETWAT